MPLPLSKGSISQGESSANTRRPVEEYISAIQKPSTWGGAIELSIFSSHFSTEISSFDVQSGRIDRFGEGQYDNRCILIYSGIHYDALSLSPSKGAPASFHTTVFPVHDDSVLDAARKLVDGLKGRHYYTDTATFDLRCGVCGVGLKGEKGAREHAMSTGRELAAWVLNRADL
jgi:ubiquitin thioesterase OTU1